ncbi:hypothetical protein [Corynebacterium sp. UBA2622]|uniref:hypothetical protein n=1 Tax=Corynebacterium sp. UBA2622 TaxID=1946393 RepID=UPI0025C29775|nr:hypothetical protein [Corynebacterium sp. UBA2622]
MGAPVPHDPRAPRIDGDTLSAQIRDILAEPSGSLREELDQLTRAHVVLHEALQKG